MAAPTASAISRCCGRSSCLGKLAVPAPTPVRWPGPAPGGPRPSSELARSPTAGSYYYARL